LPTSSLAFGIRGRAGPTFRVIRPVGFPDRQTDPDRSHCSDATACIAISSKMNDVRANRRALRGLARMLHGYLQKKLSAKKATAQEQTT
jgi:hypothetical protein